ncbi:MAG: alpha/beta hydrolase fold domain-containing protein [Bryobacteraceae bacterium]|nr:alpha/beta hydrolase fold domain-containing protein [Bryobacteraceae bacterium]
MRRLLFLITSLAWAQAPTIVPANVVAEMDVEYSRVGERVFLDIFRPAGDAGTNPAVLAIHGGGFRAGKRTSYHPLCIKLAQRGYTCATMSYRLAPRHQFPAPVEDAKAAVRFLRANAKKYGIDPARIGVTGGSAGGHLALMVGLTGPLKVFEGSGPNRDQSSAVQAVVNFYGPTDFTQSYGKSVDAHEVLPLFLGGDLAHNRQEHLTSSPLYYVTPLSPPILSVHGTKDTYVAYEHSVWLTSKLLSAGVDAELETLTGAGHGFKGADAERAEARLFAYFDKHLKPEAKQTPILVSDHGLRGEVVGMLWPSGRELFTRPNERGHDAQSLPGGHILYTVGAKGKVVEVDAQGREVWAFSTGLEHPLAAQRLPNGRTLIGDAKQGRVIEVEPSGKVVWEYQSADLANMRMRNVNRTAAGTTLIAVEAVAKLIEVDADKKIVWQWQSPEGDKRRLYQGRRLANGHTMVSLSDPGEVLELDSAGQVVRSVGGKRLDTQFGWASGLAVLPNGNWLIADYTGRRLVEMDAKGNVVNQLRTGERTIATVVLVE